ncbi:Clathrin interactor EPSIN 1 [Rhynchospora pubera]|uniref:Clathrin interactor EPSIN 1 n=1 Tax=Rhynchospora pubera TaxID=906938 RepID=A0AAV8DXC0_9POAL|nr:Clathrin interactor EPSIN 1 [Rhynchospora pubera]
MDFMKVFDQTVREIKREVNLKVLKVPEIEQKVLDATDDEPWGPHGSALSEIASATKKFTECQMIMNVLWTRLTEGSARWRHAYKSLTVIEYLIANGSERAVDDILEHTSRISALSRFEYVEPNGKDTGINVRKKVETIMNLVNDMDKIKAVREKAKANREKYVGLSSSGITYKSSSASYGGSSGGYGSDDRYGSIGSSRDADSFKDEDSYTIKERKKSSEGVTSDNGFSKSKKGTSSSKKDSASKPSPNKGLGPSKTYSAPSNDDLGDDDDFDDFDPRGSAKYGVDATANTSTKTEVDLFGPNLMDDFMDAPSVAPTNSAAEKADEVDLFADADFQSAPPQPQPNSSSQTQIGADLFSGEASFTPAFPSATTDFFSAPEPSLYSDTKTKASIPNPVSSEPFDPFASIPMNNFSSDPFGDFTANVSATTPEKETQNKTSDPLADDSFGTFTSASAGTNTSPTLGGTSAKPNNAKGGFQVKSGIWADSLSRGLIDLNITAPKKVNLADIGIVGGLEDATNEKDKFSFGPASYLGSGPGLGLPGGSSTGGSKLSGFGQQQFGNFK